MSSAAIRVQGISKYFVLPHQRPNTIKSFFVNPFNRYEVEKQRAFSDVSFEVKKGEFFGIVGRNGSGKSTLLKCIAGVYTPDSGKIKVNGKLVPFIELGVGFNPELSGRDNVYLNGALLGFNRKEIARMYDDIVEFSELERFMDQKLKNYSSGMQVRLAFSIAIQAKGDILLLDEVLAVGDSAFQQKCNDYFEKIKQEGRTVILVTHSMDAVQKYCDRALIVDEGRILDEGSPDAIVAQYSLLNMPRKKEDALSGAEHPDVKRPLASIERVYVNGGQDPVIREDNAITLEFDFRVQKPSKVVAGISIIRSDNVYATYYTTVDQLGILECTPDEGVYSLRYILEPNQLGKGAYRVDVALYDSIKRNNYLAKISDAARFAVRQNNPNRGGILNVKGEWSLNQ